MAVYRIFGEHLISEGEFAVKGAEVTRLVAAGSGAQPSITLDNGGVLSFAAVDVGQGDAVAFPAVAYGKPMTIDIRSVYTGNVGSKSLFDGTGDIAVVSGVKDWSSVKASARGLNFVASKTGRHALLAGPDALSDGTRLVAYQKAVATAQVVASFEIVAAPPDPVLLTKLGGAFTAAAGVPLFLPYAGALLAAGQLVPLAGSLIDAIGARSPGWHQSAELSFDLPGYAPVAADFRLVAPATSDLQKLRYRANVGLIDRDDRLYTGDEPYVVIAVYGGERPELEGFTPGVVAADMARRFYPSKTGVATGLDDVLEIAKVASDWRFNRQATDLQARIAKTTDAVALEQLKRQLSAVLANIVEPALVPAAGKA